MKGLEGVRKAHLTLPLYWRLALLQMWEWFFMFLFLFWFSLYSWTKTIGPQPGRVVNMTKEFSRSPKTIDRSDFLLISSSASTHHVSNSWWRKSFVQRFPQCFLLSWMFYTHQVRFANTGRTGNFWDSGFPAKPKQIYFQNSNSSVKHSKMPNCLAWKT